MISPFAVCSTGCDQGLIANNKMPLGRVAFFVSIDINPLLNFRYATCGSICASHSICAVAQEGFISYRIAKQHIAKNTEPSIVFFGSRLLLCGDML